MSNYSKVQVDIQQELENFSKKDFVTVKERNQLTIAYWYVPSLHEWYKIGLKRKRLVRWLLFILSYQHI